MKNKKKKIKVFSVDKSSMKLSRTTGPGGKRAQVKLLYIKGAGKASLWR
jgi:hypothetical protein